MPLSPTRFLLAALVAVVAPTAAVGSSGAGAMGPDPGGSQGEATAAADRVDRAPRVESGVEASVLRSTERAVATLGRHVREQSHPEALRLAFQAYYGFAATRPDAVKKPYFFFVDYGLSNERPRGYVFDMESLTLVDGPFTVAHGSGSSDRRNGVPTRFSNRPGSYASSLGLYVARETYRFSGRSGGKRYSSIGLRLDGVSGSFNSAARRRGIVSHGAPYVTAGDAGRSQGCPAMEQHRARTLLPMLAGGGMVFLFSPRDHRWLREGPWVRASVAAGGSASR